MTKLPQWGTMSPSRVGEIAKWGVAEREAGL